nr:TonB-dependent receptor plug domain-containing protein [Ralstonia mannitolilytica]
MPKHINTTVFPSETTGHTALRPVVLAARLTCVALLGAVLPVQVMAQGTAAEVTATLPATTAVGRGETAQSPGKGFVAKQSAAGTKTDTPIIETPQSISVVTQQQLDDQKPRGLSEALNYTSGAFTALVGASNRYDYVALRGFNAAASTTPCSMACA